MGTTEADAKVWLKMDWSTWVSENGRLTQDKRHVFLEIVILVTWPSQVNGQSFNHGQFSVPFGLDRHPLEFARVYRSLVLQAAGKSHGDTG